MSIETLLKSIVACFSKEQQDQQDNVDDVVQRLALEELLAAPKDEPAIELQRIDESPAFGDQAMSYGLALPSADETTGYEINYVAEGIELNDKTTTATYTAEITDGKLFEAAKNAIEAAREANETNQAKSVYMQPLDERERTNIFKLLHPAEWKLMYELKETARIF